MIIIFRTMFDHIKYSPLPWLCKELRGILGVCSRKGDAIFQKPPMNVYNLFISKSVLLKPIQHSSSLPLSQSFPPVFFYFFLQNPVIYFAYLNSSFVFSCVITLAIMSIVVVDVAVVLAVAIRERASTKRDIFL